MLYYNVGLVIGYKQFSIKSETTNTRSLGVCQPVYRIVILDINLYFQKYYVNLIK
jgi:hypothetical protein